MRLEQHAPLAFMASSDDPWRADVDLDEEWRQVEEMMAFCTEHFGERTKWSHSYVSGFLTQNQWRLTVFAFTDIRDAILFKMRFY